MFEEYLFLWIVAFVWIVFAVVQDLRTREVSNWLNFSFIAIVLAYRAFYAVLMSDVMFFVWGIVGVLVFVGLAYGFYYGKVFAGGDAKLLMGLGGIWPYSGLGGVVVYGGGFVFALFAAGAVYSIIYSFVLALNKWGDFKKAFRKEFLKYRKFVLGGFVLAVVLQAIVYGVGFEKEVFGVLSLIVLLGPILVVYAKSIEKGCMLVWKDAKDLSEGEWLEKDVKVNGKWIRKSVHGLSVKDIKLLRKHGKKVLIKDGVPFTPAFLIGFLAMIWILRYSPF